jgi:hypothetical protein
MTSDLTLINCIKQITNSMKPLLTITMILFSFAFYAQDKLPYYEIPKTSENFTAGTVAARMIDGLGFRYYWATDGLTTKDLEYKSNEKVRSTMETVNHIYDLSVIIVNSTLKKPNIKSDEGKLSFEELRKQTLINLKTAADILRKSDDISQFKIIFGENEIPFWNNINGPIADSIWHSGQIASFRRSSGNEINPNINHFNGTVKN